MATTYANPPFDARILRLSLGTKLTRGRIVNQSPQGKYIYACNFLYNPSTVDLSHSIDMGDAGTTPLPNDARDPRDPTKYILATPSGLSFSLLFDRTYELWDINYNKVIYTSSGVDHDIAALYRVVGLKDSPAAKLITGPMIPVPSFVTFGGPNSLTFYGYIDSLNVTYTHWTQAMVPVRATAAVHMSMYPYSQESTATSRAQQNAHSVSSTTSHPLARTSSQLRLP